MIVGSGRSALKKTLIVATRRTIPKETAWLVVVCNNGASRERSDRGSGRSGPDPMLSRSSRRASPRLLSEFCSWDHPLAEIDRGWTTTRIGSQRNLISALAASVSRFRVQSEVEKGSRERTAEATNMRRSACLQSSYLARDLRRTASTIPSPSNVCTGPEQDCILPPYCDSHGLSVAFRAPPPALDLCPLTYRMLYLP